MKKSKRRTLKVEFEVDEMATYAFLDGNRFSIYNRRDIKGYLKRLTDYDEFRKVKKIKIRISKPEDKGL